MRQSFFFSEIGHPHTGRARAIIRAHPEVRQLMGRNPWTLLIALAVVSLQTALAFLFGKLGFGYWWLNLLVAYGVGAFANHSMYVLIHDAIHNLILPGKSWNKMIAIFADLPNLVPGAMGFGIYHLKHHSHQGDYEYDADLANQWEARLVGNRWYAKALWLLLFPIMQLTRPPRIKALRMWNRWIFLNLICALAYNAAIVYSADGPACFICSVPLPFPSACTRSGRAGSRNIIRTILTRRPTVITGRSIGSASTWVITTSIMISRRSPGIICPGCARSLRNTTRP